MCVSVCVSEERERVRERRDGVCVYGGERGTVTVCMHGCMSALMCVCVRVCSSDLRAGCAVSSKLTESSPPPALHLSKVKDLVCSSGIQVVFLLVN